MLVKIYTDGAATVSYTHLDVYKRQYHTYCFLTLALPGFLFSELDIFPQHGKMYTN